jgi:TPR repeat protein
VSVREHDWTTAATLWQRVYDQKKGKLRRLAAFNLALYHEMQDELPEALTWIERAADGVKPGADEARQVDIYRLNLQERAKELGKLTVQMQRFDEKN